MPHLEPLSQFQFLMRDFGIMFGFNYLLYNNSYAYINTNVMDLTTLIDSPLRLLYVSTLGADIFVHPANKELYSVKKYVLLRTNMSNVKSPCFD